MMQKCTAIVWVSATCALLAMGGGAEARIVCVNGNQSVQGSWLATPYCQDALVAQVAHEYGVSASAAAIRNNPNFKRHVCDLVNPHGRVPF